MSSLVLASCLARERTTDVIFIMRNVEEKHHAKKKLYYAFADLENKFVPREVLRWVTSFCYLGDTLDGNGADIAVTARIRN